MFCWHSFFLFFPRKISELRQPIAAKFCSVIGSVFDFIILVQIFRGGSPQKILGSKNMQNLARFQTTSNFGGEYLRNG